MQAQLPGNPERCHNQDLHRISHKITVFDRLRNLRLRLRSALYRRLARRGIILDALSADIPRMNEPGQLPNSSASAAEEEAQSGPFEPGDLVEILPYEEIQKTLDAERRCGGLTFLLLMRRYCGRRAYVYKRVRMIYDERLQKMVKIRNTYLLEGVICDGRDFFSKEGCDKSCFLFWKDKWLRKVKE